ncbi:MAG: transketolase [Candidatus Paceibacteria bacterium]|jgi:transketolase
MQTLKTAPSYETLSNHFGHWKKTGDLIDQCIDLALNLRQSGHPGGSRSKVPFLVSTTLGVMRWDVRRPELAFGDRFVLVAGHANPAVYGMLAVYNEALRIRFEQTGDERYLVPNAAERQLTWEDLLTLRHRGGLPGHAEMEGKTLFFKFNTGPSGHGAPAALGEAMALKHAGTGDVRVFAMEGEGGHTAGCHHEVKNSAYGLGLDNLIYLMDWNDHGIDSFANSEVSVGSPPEWFEPYGWRTAGTTEGESYEQITKALLDVVHAESTDKKPGMVWAKTRKGRGFYIYDALSHGKSHGRNSEGFWKCRKDFQDIYGVEFEGFGNTEDPGEDATREMTKGWFATVFDVLRKDQELVEYLSDRLVELGESVPTAPEGFKAITKTNLTDNKGWLAIDQLPKELFLEPGKKAANKDGFAKFGAWMNSLAKQQMGRPLVLACSADLADSTSISGFSKGFGDTEGFGWYDRNSNTGGSLLPQQITEFTNSGLSVGVATVNMSSDPENHFDGYWASCSTYASFSYLKYGMMRLFSQVAQDSPIKVGKVIWVAGHSGPETCEDSRTHFGIFSPGVTQLFPEGQVINLHPWEHNEVAPALAAALATDVPIIALHLTRPGITIPDRGKLGVPSYLEAAKGAYIIRDYDPKRPKEGTLIVQGTSTTDTIFDLLPQFESGEAPNVKIIAAVSWELFQLQDRAWRDKVLPRHDWLDSTVLTNGARRLMHDWLPHKVAEHYAMSSDWDNNWRTGGSYTEVKEEAHLDAKSVLEGIRHFAAKREERLRLLGHPG